MTIPAARTAPGDDPRTQAVTFANVFTQAALDAAHHGITPDVIEVHRIGGGLNVGIQIPRQDSAAVDRLADYYGLAPDNDPLSLLYGRAGHTLIADDYVAVRVYCGRPLRVVT